MQAVNAGPPLPSLRSTLPREGEAIGQKLAHHSKTLTVSSTKELIKWPCFVLFEVDFGI